jgi:predicted phosphodiesterase
MRLAAISDVHGNFAALDAVMADIGTQDVDVVVNLGDLLSGAVEPRETADRLMDLGLLTVRGNHERQLLTLSPDRMGLSDRHAHEAITARHREWLAGLPLMLEVADGVLAFHGSPTDDLTYLLETVEVSGARPATPEEVTERLGPFADTPLLLCGHTHLQRSMRLPTGALVLNPGSVGGPPTTTTTPIPTSWRPGRRTPATPSPSAPTGAGPASSGPWGTTGSGPPRSPRPTSDPTSPGRCALVGSEPNRDFPPFPHLAAELSTD